MVPKIYMLHDFCIPKAVTGRDEFGKEDIEYDPNNDKSDSDDSNDWLPSLSNKPRDEFELDTIGQRTITQLRQTAHRLN